MTTISKATVETLVAEVRVLMVGSRQITLSVARQLDWRPLEEIEPFGRVRLVPGDSTEVCVIGRDIVDGTLVRSALHYAVLPQLRLSSPIMVCDGFRHSDQWDWVLTFNGRRFSISSSIFGCHLHQYGPTRCQPIWSAEGLDTEIAAKLAAYDAHVARCQAAAKLPLIVLAGLR